MLTSDVTISAGALSDLATTEMPNGWQFTLSVGEYLDHNGVSWEGKGIKPEVEIASTPQEVQAGKDQMLEAALQLLP